MDIIKEDLVEVRDKYGDERRTDIEYSAEDFKIEDMIVDEDVVITISHLGYIKRTPLTEYRRQHRGGVGSKGSTTRDEDFLEHIFIASMHNFMLFFTQQGQCFWKRVFEIPEGTKVSKGRAIQNIINIPPDDKVMAYFNVKNLSDEDYINNNYIVLCTKKGIIKKTTLEAYSRPRQNGIIAIKIREGDQLLEAKLTDGKNQILLGIKSGNAIRFNEDRVRPMGRNASGVKGITLKDKKDEVVGMICVKDEEETVLVVAENGFGKRSKVDDYRLTNRGGKGVKTINITEKTGNLIAIKSVEDSDDLMIINKSGVAIRLGVSGLRVMGRATQGVKVINLRENDSIAAVTKVAFEDEDESLLEGEEGENLIEGEGEGEDADTREEKPDSNVDEESTDKSDEEGESDN